MALRLEIYICTAVEKMHSEKFYFLLQQRGSLRLCIRIRFNFTCVRCVCLPVGWGGGCQKRRAGVLKRGSGDKREGGGVK